MPTYSYACTECGNRFDAVQAFTDDPVTTCPKCSGRVRKLFNSVGVVFKGSGFYRTDSRAGSNGALKGEKSGEKSNAESSSSTEKSAPANGQSGASQSGASQSGAGKSGANSSAPAAAAS